MQNLLGMTIEELKQFAARMGEKPFRGKQIFIWLSRGMQSFDEMTDLPKSLREKLEGCACIGGCRAIQVQEDESDGTRKILFESAADSGDAAAPADTFEGVFMKYSYGNSLCVSSQVGCRMGCRFCASGLGGLVRNLTAGEMLGQVLEAERVTGEKVGHIVIMGMGEPFDNYDNVAKFLKLLHEEEGRNMSWRNMTVSTCGIIPKIEQFAEDFPQVNLAISLHRLTDEGRSAIMPVNRKYPVDLLLKAAADYTEKTHRRVTFEYALIEGENDSDGDAKLMVRKFGGMLCHVNLIPLNKVDGTGLDGSSRTRAKEIAETLEAAGIPATVRRQLGSGIDGACGQLRRGNRGI
ncbi:MAG: 23S rRNA (adenine(2503)-C(2))-methyltransferase RlmN [Bacillota bacterium]